MAQYDDCFQPNEIRLTRTEDLIRFFPKYPELYYHLPVVLLKLSGGNPESHRNK